MFHLHMCHHLSVILHTVYTSQHTYYNESTVIWDTSSHNYIVYIYTPVCHMSCHYIASILVAWVALIVAGDLNTLDNLTQSVSHSNRG